MALQVAYGWLCVQVAQSRKIVVFTGAGISTACGIPDFRGPAGSWTLQRAHKPIPKFKVSFGVAEPSITHQVGSNASASHLLLALMQVLLSACTQTLLDDFATGSCGFATHRQATVCCLRV